MLRLSLTFLALCSLGVAQPAKKITPAKWSLEFQPATAKQGGIAIGKLTATIDEPYHMYSPTTPSGGPMITKITLADNEVAESMEIYRPKPVRKLDPNFGIEAETYEKQAIFFLKMKLKDSLPVQPAQIAVKMRYQVCTEKECLPQRSEVSATLKVAAKVDPSVPAASFKMPEGYALVPAATSKAAVTDPVKKDEVPSSAPSKGSDSMLSFALLAFGLGLGAVFTPCVFPMIPFTVSAFIRSNSVLQAAVYAGGIVLSFTALGLLLTAMLGPFGVQQLGSNPWVNGIIAIVFFAFALSLLGAFELQLPSSILTKMDAASQKQGGVVGALLMGLTFALTSFACTGPFMGSLLAASVTGGSKLQPAIGMAAFSSGLASPFFFLALFPQAMSKMPKSGSWLPRVKTVLGFVLMAGSLKYLSNVDQVLQWEFLTRERFLAAWVVLFALPGLYLLGFLRMEGIKTDQPMGAGRAVAGALFLIFALSLLPGMFGGKLGELDAYVPFAKEQTFGASAGGGEKQPWFKNQYHEALAKAKAEGKLLLVNFTGYACTNCHWMKANMFPRAEIQAELKNFVLLELYTDGLDAESEKNAELENTKFSTVAIPFYAVLDGDEKVVSQFSGRTTKTEEFLPFLKTGGTVNRASAEMPEQGK